MHIIDNYCYNTRKNIFYDKDLSKEEIVAINANIPDNDLYESAINYFNAFDFTNLKSKGYMPIEGGLCLTYNCQLRCSYCSYSSSEGSQFNVTENDVKIFIDYLIKNITIQSLHKKETKKIKIPITGAGEPTYSWSFFKNVITCIREKCKKNNIDCTIDLTTNGMLNEEQIDFICENINSVMISYDGLKEFQDKNRVTNKNQNSSNIVEKTIKLFDEKNKIPMSIRTTIWHEDFAYLRKMADNIYSNYDNFTDWSIVPIAPFGRALDKYNTNDEHDFVESFLDVVKYVADKYKKYNTGSLLFADTLVDSILYCGSALSKHPWLMPNKNIITCIEPTHGQPTIGRINNGKVELYDHYEDRLMMICKDVFETCRECIAFRFCKGGCPMRMFGQDYKIGQEHTKDNLSWECKTKQKYARYKLESIIRNKGQNGCNCMFEKIESEELKNIDVYKMNERCKCNETNAE